MQFTDFTDFFGITNTHLNEPAQQPQSQQQDQQAQQQATPQKPKKENRETLYKWEAYSRPVIQPFSKKTTKTLMIIGIIISLLLVAMQEFFLILVILSLIFVSYMLSQMPPEKVRYQITNQGIKYDDRFYFWGQLGEFFFTTNYDLESIAVDVTDGLPARLFLTVGPNDKEKVKNMLDDYLYFLAEEPKTVIDRAYESVIDKINLER